MYSRESVLKLSDLQVKDTAIVMSLQTASAAMRQKLFACGLVPGAEFTVNRIAPFGDPIQIELTGDIMLSIRKSEGCAINVKKI